MSGIVLSASVRQNLLSLQSTADLLATTQNRLATGKKVNTALDNPDQLFTAASLDNRASDINNLLDGIGNGVQVLQAANTGITSLQKLVDSAKSVANQALQTTVGYSTKSTVTTTAITGATASDLLGTVGAPTDAAAAPGSVVDEHLTVPVAITGATLLAGTRRASDNSLPPTSPLPTPSSSTASPSTSTAAAARRVLRQPAPWTSTSRPARSRTSWPRSTRSPARRCLDHHAAAPITLAHRYRCRPRHQRHRPWRSLA